MSAFTNHHSGDFSGESKYGYKNKVERFAHRNAGANSIIPLRYEVPLNRTTGFYRRKLKMNFPLDVYHQRSKIETVNSVEKRKFGDRLRGRLLKTQRREMKVVDVVYNIHRYINYYASALLGFLQSHNNWKKQEILGWKTPNSIYNDERYFNKNA